MEIKITSSHSLTQTSSHKLISTSLIVKFKFQQEFGQPDILTYSVSRTCSLSHNFPEALNFETSTQINLQVCDIPIEICSFSVLQKFLVLLYSSSQAWPFLPLPAVSNHFLLYIPHPMSSSIMSYHKFIYPFKKFPQMTYYVPGFDNTVKLCAHSKTSQVSGTETSVCRATGGARREGSQGSQP